MHRKIYYQADEINLLHAINRYDNINMTIFETGKLVIYYGVGEEPTTYIPLSIYYWENSSSRYSSNSEADSQESLGNISRNHL